MSTQYVTRSNRSNASSFVKEGGEEDGVDDDIDQINEQVAAEES